MTDIFISYRRDDAAFAAGRLVDFLANHYPRSQLVIDVDSLPPGIDFLKGLLQRIDRAGVLLAIIGPRWLNIRDEHGTRRLDNPLDVVRIEIEYALGTGKIVIPVLLEDAHMPEFFELPRDLERLSACNAVRLTHARFRVEANELIKVLVKIAKPRRRLVRWFSKSSSHDPTEFHEKFLLELERRLSRHAEIGDDREGVLFLPVMTPSSVYMNRFLIKAHLGRGGFADAYLAIDVNTTSSGDVVLKLFRFDNQRAYMIVTMEHELQIYEHLKSLEIPGFVKGTEVGFLPGRYGAYIVQEYVPAVTLRSSMSRKAKMSIPTAVSIAESLSVTLDGFHRHGLAHCDVKPDNILLPIARPHAPLLTDAGSARWIRQSGNVTSVTWPYSPPELFRPRGMIDGRADVYSLGVTLLHMVVGLPQSEVKDRYYDFATFARPPSLPAEKFDFAQFGRMHQEILSSLARIDDIRVQRILRRALSMAPEERQTTILEFATELHEVVQAPD